MYFLARDEIERESALDIFAVAACSNTVFGLGDPWQALSHYSETLRVECLPECDPEQHRRLYLGDASKSTIGSGSVLGAAVKISSRHLPILPWLVAHASVLELHESFRLGPTVCGFLQQL